MCAKKRDQQMYSIRSSDLPSLNCRCVLSEKYPFEKLSVFRALKAKDQCSWCRLPVATVKTNFGNTEHDHCTWSKCLSHLVTRSEKVHLTRKTKKKDHHCCCCCCSHCCTCCLLVQDRTTVPWGLQYCQATAGKNDQMVQILEIL